MKSLMKVAVLAVMVLFAATLSIAADEKRPVQPDDVLKKARDNYGKESIDMLEGKAGATYGVKGYDYLTGVGKRFKVTDKKTEISSVEKGVSGYAKGTGETELWDRKEKVGKLSEAEARDQWVNNWSGKYNTVVAGADPNQGKHWFYFYCVSCHGWQGQGDGPNAIEMDPRPRPLTKGDYMNKRTNVQIFGTIKGGGVAVELADAMPAWGNVLQDQDIWNVVAFLRAISDAPYTASPNDVTPLNASKNAEFKELQEIIEAQLGGRGGGLVGGYSIEGGNRKVAK